LDDHKDILPLDRLLAKGDTVPDRQKTVRRFRLGLQVGRRSRCTSEVPGLWRSVRGQVERPGEVGSLGSVNEKGKLGRHLLQAFQVARRGFKTRGATVDQDEDADGTPGLQPVVLGFGPHDARGDHRANVPRFSTDSTVSCNDDTPVS